MHRGFAFDLDLTDAQSVRLGQWMGSCRAVYNAALEQRRDWWRQYKANTGRSINWASQSVEVTALRQEFDWIRDVPRACLEYALRDLDKGFEAFFAGRSNFPRMRARRDQIGLRFQGKNVQTQSLNAKWGRVRIPTIGWLKFRSTRPILGVVKNVTVREGPFGWQIVFATEIAHDTPANFLPAVGIDRGVATTLALSDGATLSLPDMAGLETAHRRAQRTVARRKKGSRRRLRAVQRAARLKARAARIRRDFHHRAALNIANRFGAAVLEDLPTAKMTASARGTVEKPGRNVRRKAGLNRAILNAGWSQFQAILTYKMEERGGRVITVNPAYSSQTCSACGVIDARSRESQAVFACVACGHRDHADVNAAKEILRRGSTPCLRVEGSRQRPGEARTRAVRKHGSNPVLIGAGGC